MSRKSDAELASAFGVPVEIIPFIPELLADLWSLGVPPGAVVELLRPLNLPPLATRFLDLGCGKGAVSITLARELGFYVHGIDFFPPFIREARQRAADRGLSRLCRFTVGDMRETVRAGGDYHIAALIWVGGVLGDAGESVGKLRQMVGPGGYMVYAEGYLKEDGGPVAAAVDMTHGGRAGRGEILHELASHGDKVVAEVTVPRDETRALYALYVDSLRRGAERITEAHPEHSRTLKAHIAAQERMCRILETAVVPALWLLRKNSP